MRLDHLLSRERRVPEGARIEVEADGGDEVGREKPERGRQAKSRRNPKGI